MIEFNYRLLSNIAQRGHRVLAEAGIDEPVLDIMLDIEHTMAVCPLDLSALDAFDAGNFAHDIIGIYVNFNRDTRELDNCFLPRCAISQGTQRVNDIMKTLTWNPEASA